MITAAFCFCFMDPYKIFVVHQEVFANTGKVPKRWNGDKTASASNVKRDNLFHNHSLTLVWYLVPNDHDKQSDTVRWILYRKKRYKSPYIMTHNLILYRQTHTEKNTQRETRRHKPHRGIPGITLSHK